MRNFIETSPAWSAVIFTAFALICLGIQWYYFDRNKM